MYIFPYFPPSNPDLYYCNQLYCFSFDTAAESSFMTGDGLPECKMPSGIEGDFMFRRVPNCTKHKISTISYHIAVISVKIRANVYRASGRTAVFSKWRVQLRENTQKNYSMPYLRIIVKKRAANKNLSCIAAFCTVWYFAVCYLKTGRFLYIFSVF